MHSQNLVELSPQEIEGVSGAYILPILAVYFGGKYLIERYTSGV